MRRIEANSKVMEDSEADYFCKCAREFCEKHDFDFNKCEYVLIGRDEAIKCNGALYKNHTFWLDVKAKVPKKCLSLYRKYCKSRSKIKRMDYLDWLMQKGYVTEETLDRIIENEKREKRTKGK